MKQSIYLITGKVMIDSFDIPGDFYFVLDQMSAIEIGLAEMPKLRGRV